MTNESAWPATWNQAIGRRIASVRRGADMSAQALADACTALNFPIGRGTIAKLENGGRESIGIHELVVIAAALGVRPVELLFPGALETPHVNESAVEYFPGAPIPMREAWDRFVGPSSESPSAVRIAQARDGAERVVKLLDEAQSHRG